MTRIWTALALVLAFTGGALAQSPPAFIPPGGNQPRQLYNGDIPTATQWNNFFEAKQDYSPGSSQCTSLITCLINGGPLGTPSSGNLANTTGYPASALVGSISVPKGGTGQASFTAGLPLVGNGTNPLTQGSVSGNTTAFITADGTLVNGHCPQIDSAGGLIDSGASCGGGGGGSGTVNAGTTGQLTYYASSGTAVSGATTGTGVVTALGVSTGSAGAVVVNGGALGTPASGTLTNATGLPLTTGVTGTLPVPNGGTGVSTLTSGALLRGNGSSAVSATTTGTGVLTALGLGVNTTGGIATYPVATGIPNLSGSAQSTTGTIGASSHSLTLGTALDFVNGQGIRINHAGAAFTLNAPTGTGVASLNVTGSTTYQYKVASIDAAGGVGAATASFQTTTGNATLNFHNLNALYWSAPSGTAPTAYAVYKNISGTFTLIGVIGSAVIPQAYQFFDIGYTAYPYTDWAPQTAPASAVADALITTISSGGGTTTLSLTGAATTAGTAVGVYHDDSAAIAAALSASPSTVFPSGTFYAAQPSTVTANETVSGQYSATILRSVFPGQSIFVLSNAGGNPGTFNRITGLEFQLVPNSNGISSNGTNGIYQSSIDHLICQGGSVGGGGGQPNCVYFAGTIMSTISDVFADTWLAGSGTGAGCTGYGNNGGGDTAAITIDYNAIVPNFGNTIYGLTMINDGCSSQFVGAWVTFNNSGGLLSNSYINGGNGANAYWGGWVGVENEGPGQSLYLQNNQILGFYDNLSMDSTAQGTPLQMSVVGNEFDFCGHQCIALNAGSWVNLQNDQFVGEANSPWLYTTNVGIYGASGFTSGPNVIGGNTFHNFSLGSAYGIHLLGTMTNTTVCANQYTNNATNFSGTAGSGSYFGCQNVPD